VPHVRHDNARRAEHATDFVIRARFLESFQSTLEADEELWHRRVWRCLCSTRVYKMTLISALLMSAAALSGNAVTPPPAVAAGIAAYHAGDFTTALAILKPVVYDVPRGDPGAFSDPWATAYLAQMFRRGEGAAPDWPLSCALFNNVWAYTRQGGPGGIGTIPFVEDGIKEVCLPELQAEVNALRTACYLDGVTRREFVLDGGSWIVFDRRGFHIDGGGGERREIPLTMWCHDVMVSLTESDVSIPDRWSSARVHFLELFKWTNGFDRTNGAVVRQLHWIVYLVRGSDLGPASDQVMLTVMDGPYPSPELPPGVRDAAVLQLNAAGQVEWLVKTSGRKRGIIAEPSRAEISPSLESRLPGDYVDEPASDFAVRFDHKGCHYEYLDMFKGTYSGDGSDPVHFVLSTAQRATLFKAIVAARIFELPAVTDASGGEPADNYELEVRNGGKRRTVSWRLGSADRSLTALVRTILDMVNPRPGDGCVGGPPKVR